LAGEAHGGFSAAFLAIQEILSVEKEVAVSPQTSVVREPRPDILA